MTSKMKTDQGCAAVESAASTSTGSERISVLEAFASELVPVGPNMSNRSTPPANTDFDDQ